MTPIDRGNQLGGQAGGLGLVCTLEGVFLAGTPLLRRTINGLAPRPIAELTALLKSAYGQGIDPSRPYPGLEVVARALNQGDVGRAMVAAIQMRLPDLDEEGAAHIACADEALRKYDPNEARDGRGRWTTGGGSPPIRATNPATREQSSAPAKSPAPHKPSRSTKPAMVAPESRSAGMKPILVSNFDEHIGGVPIASLIVNIALTRECTNNAQEPRYYDKTQLCAAVYRECSWLLEVNKNNVFRRDACIWPDGSAAMMKFGVLVPFKAGHKF